MKCIYCRTRIFVTDRRCPYCGAEIFLDIGPKTKITTKTDIDKQTAEILVIEKELEPNVIDEEQYPVGAPVQTQVIPKPKKTSEYKYYSRTQRRRAERDGWKRRKVKHKDTDSVFTLLRKVGRTETRNDEPYSLGYLAYVIILMCGILGLWVNPTVFIVTFLWLCALMVMYKIIKE